MPSVLEAQIWYDKKDKKYHVDYKGIITDYDQLNDLLTFLGKKLLFLKNDIEFRFDNPDFI